MRKTPLLISAALAATILAGCEERKTTQAEPQATPAAGTSSGQTPSTPAPGMTAPDRTGAPSPGAAGQDATGTPAGAPATRPSGTDGTGGGM